MSSSHRQIGFTLVELLVAMLIGLLITLGALTLINSLFRSYEKVDDLARQQERITFTVESMIRGFRNAQCWAMTGSDEDALCERRQAPLDCEDVDLANLSDVSCIHENGRELQLGFDDGGSTRIYKYSQSGGNLIEDDGNGDVVVIDGLQENGFLVCQGDADNKENTAYLFRVSFCLVGSDCVATNDSPNCIMSEAANQWDGWVRFYAVSKSLAIDKMLSISSAGGE